MQSNDRMTKIYRYWRQAHRCFANYAGTREGIKNKIDRNPIKVYTWKNMLTITQKDYQRLLRRQDKIEAELNLVKKVVHEQVEEERIHPKILKRWERISRDLDRGKGRSFSSLFEMKRWLKNL